MMQVSAYLLPSFPLSFEQQASAQWAQFVYQRDCYMTYIASWSGGKDSCLACWLALQKGLTVSCLVHFDRPNNLHGVDPSLIRLQAQMARIPMVQKHVASEDFGQEFRKIVGDL